MNNSEIISPNISEKPEVMPTPTSTNSNKWLLKVGLLGLAGLLLVVSVVSAGYWYGTKSATLNQNKFGSEQDLKSQIPTPTQIVVSGPTPDQTVDSKPTLITTSTPTPTPFPTQQPLFNLGFSTIDYSKPTSKGAVPGAIVRLYDDKDKLLGEKTVPPFVYEGNISKGGNAMFNIPLGTYKAIAETDKLKGTITVTIKSFKDQQYYSIYMYAKPIQVAGKYFFDANKNNSYDEGEQVFAGKKINAFLRTGPASFELYTAGSTTTDDSGNFSFSLKYTGSYAFGAEQILGYQELPQRWIDLSGGDSATYNIYLWPL